MAERDPQDVPETPAVEPIENPPDEPAVEDTDLEVGWDEKSLDGTDDTVDGVPVEDTVEPVEWLEEGDVVLQP